MYERRFGKAAPDSVLPIEEIARRKQEKKAARRVCIALCSLEDLLRPEGEQEDALSLADFDDEQ